MDIGRTMFKDCEGRKVFCIVKILLLVLIFGTLVIKREHSDQLAEIIDKLHHIYCNVQARSSNNL